MKKETIFTLIVSTKYTHAYYCTSSVIFNQILSCLLPPSIITHTTYSTTPNQISKQYQQSENPLNLCCYYFSSILKAFL